MKVKEFPFTKMQYKKGTVKHVKGLKGRGKFLVSLMGIVCNIDKEVEARILKELEPCEGIEEGSVYVVRYEEKSDMFGEIIY